MPVPERPSAYDTKLDASIPPDPVAIRAALDATLAEPPRLHALAEEQFIRMHGRPADSVVPSAEVVQQFGLGTDQRSILLKEVSRASLGRELSPADYERFARLSA